jgi:phosphate acetyltransferase
MQILKEVYRKAKKKPAVIIFPESSDSRIKKAVKIIEKEKIAIPFLIQEKDDKTSLNESIKLLKEDKGDAIIGGASLGTAPLARVAFKFKKGLVSGNMLMVKNKEIYVFADISIKPEPNANDLAIIAKGAGELADLLKMKAKIAMLSFSTNKSANSASVRKVRKATEIAKRMKLNVEGEMQLDAALVKWIGKSKFKESKIAGKANVLVFPNLDAGNIGYKLAERLGNFKAIGPILSNVSKQVNILSRGCSVQDVVDLAAITSLQCQKS